MNDTVQTSIVLVIVLSAVLYLARRARQKKTCGKSDCGCVPKKPGDFK